jgi:hypothetical protein
MSPSQLGAFAPSDPSVAWPDLEYHVQPLSLDRFGEPLHRFPAITASVCQLRPASRGSIRARSADAFQAPEIKPNYLSDPYDRAVAANAIRVTRRIMSMPALQAFQPEEFKPGATYQSEEELIQAAGEIGTDLTPSNVDRPWANAAPARAKTTRTERRVFFMELRRRKFRSLGPQRRPGKRTPGLAPKLLRSVIEYRRRRGSITELVAPVAEIHGSLLKMLTKPRLTRVPPR